MILFVNDEGHDIESDISLFNQTYKDKLECNTLIGTKIYTRRRKDTKRNVHVPCFCVLLFTKDEDKVIDFASSFMWNTNRELTILNSRSLSKFTIRIRREERIHRFVKHHLNKLTEKRGKNYMNKTEEIFEYNGYLFTYIDSVIGYLITRIEDKVPPYCNEDAVYANEYYKNVKRSTMEWKENGQHGKVAFVIEPILSTIKVLVHTTLDKEKIQKLVQELQSAVNHIDEKGYYGN